MSGSINSSCPLHCDKAMIQSYFNSSDHWLCSGGYTRRHVGGHWHCGGPVCIWLTTTFRHTGKPWNQSLVGFPMTKTRRELCPVTLLWRKSIFVDSQSSPAFQASVEVSASLLEKSEAYRMEEELTDIVHLMHPNWIWRMCWNIRLRLCWQFLDPTSGMPIWMLMKVQGEDATTGSAKRTAASHGVKLLETVRNLRKTLPTFLFKMGKSWKIYVDTIRFPSWIRCSIPYYTRSNHFVERQPIKHSSKNFPGPEESTFFTFMSFKKYPKAKAQRLLHLPC